MKIKQIKLLEFLNRESDGIKKKLILFILIGSLSFAGVVGIITAEAQKVLLNPGTAPGAISFFIYLIICAMVIVCRYYTMTQVTLMSEEAVRNVRIRLIDKIRHTDLEFIEKTKRGYIYSKVAEDTDLISHHSTDILNIFDNFLVCFFICLYVASLSVAAFKFLVIFIAFLGIVILFNYTSVTDKLKDARKIEEDLFERLNDIFSGFKEIKINSKKNEALFADIEALSKRTKYLKTQSGMLSNRNVVLGFASYQIVLGSMVFVVPFFDNSHSLIVEKIVAAMIFIFTILLTLSRYMNNLIAVNAAIENILVIEKKLDDFTTEHTSVADIPKSFETIALNSVKFEYTDEEGEELFTMGPVDLNIRQGEILFIAGGNGSGKSTLLKLLTGLYYPMKGGFITLDGDKVAKENYQRFRELFSIIFTDFHLFQKLYGLESVDAKEVKEFIKKMAIHKKTDYQNGGFTNIDLSTGQKKRLAYIAAVLENRPVYVLDEWAADQDPIFRRYFYDKFLNDLRAMGKTVIAVTHDDRYFDKADRVLKMEEGKIVQSITNK